MPRFGSAGNPDSFYSRGFKSSLDMPRYLAQLGLDAYEYQCGRGVTIGEQTARRLGEAAREHGIALSLHAPYYVNLATLDDHIREKTVMHLMKSLQAARWMGAGLVVFHPGAGKQGDRKQALLRAQRLLAEIIEQAGEAGLGQVLLGAETMGKPAQLGTLEEVLALCSVSSRVVPVVDFAHLHAASQGGFTRKEHFAAVLEKIEKQLGVAILKSLHIHFSQIEFTRAGEKRHRTTRDEGFGPDFAHLAELMVEYGLDCTIICEADGLQVEDALEYQRQYRELLKTSP